MVKQQLINKYYPFDKFNGTKIFYDWIRSILDKDYTVLNLGAGDTASNKIKSLKGECRVVYGVDIDSLVLKNEDLDFSFLIINNKLPFKDNFFDLIWSDYVLEHVESPTEFLSEIYRVLKPSGSFFFRTPNKYHYVSVISRFTPHWFHKLAANKVRQLPEHHHEPYETFYNLNSGQSIKSLSKQIGFATEELRFIETEPSYLMFSYPTFYLGLIYERLVNSSEIFSVFRANIFGRLVK